jgi:hypothetical protein
MKLIAVAFELVVFSILILLGDIAARFAGDPGARIGVSINYKFID